MACFTSDRICRVLDVCECGRQLLTLRERHEGMCAWCAWDVACGHERDERDEADDIQQQALDEGER
jgi:hypothetical protein